MNLQKLIPFFVACVAFNMVLTSCVSPTHNQSSTPAPSDRQPAFFGGAKQLSDSEILQISSSGQIQVSEARVITDNDASFESKIEAIRSAKPEETIRLVYFIYADDHSSSLFTLHLRVDSGCKKRGQS